MDARVRKSREKVLRTTFDLLGDGGVAGLTIDEVARRSGVAKTTIYRHWPSREAMVIDACSQIPDGQVTPDTGTLAGDVRAILDALAALLASARWTTILPSVVDAAERDDAFAAMHRGIQHGHAEPLRTAIGRAARRGEIPAGVDPEAVIPLAMGPLFYRRWYSGDPIDDAFVAGVVDGVVAVASRGRTAAGRANA